MLYIASGVMIAVIAITVAVFAGGTQAAPVVEQPAARAGSTSASQLPDARPTEGASDADPMSRSVPLRVRIPAIDVDSRLMALGLLSDGTLQTPPSAFPAGWFTGAPTPGELGPAVIAGHVRYDTAGVFARLSEVRADDAIQVDRADGSTATFRVTRVEDYAKSAFPTEKVYGNIAFAGLRLITCGALNPSTEEYEENLVVYARLVQPQ